MSENRKKLGHTLLTVAPCLIATLLAGVYILGICPSLSLTFVNILCIPLVTIVFVCGLTEEINVLKAFRFAASILIASIETFLNSGGITFETFHFGNLSLWGCGWVGLLFLSILSFLVILIRLLHWTQESWMEVKKMRQNRRMERKKFWAEYMSAWQQQRLEAQKNRQERWAQKAQHEKEILHGKQVADTQKREQGYEREKVDQEHQKEKQNESEAGAFFELFYRKAPPLRSVSIEITAFSENVRLRFLLENVENRYRKIYPGSYFRHGFLIKPMYFLLHEVPQI